MRTTTILFALVSLLSGCAHNLTLVGREGGLRGTGTAPASWGNSGRLSIDLADKTYSGKWVLASGSTGGLLTTYGAAGVSTGTVVAAGTGVGNALLSAEDGSTLRCEFTYSEWSSTGIGICQDGAGKIYDLQID